MKSVKKVIVLLALGAAITGMIGCANGPKTGANQQTQRPENVDWKGANVGSEVPEWYKIAAGGQGDFKIQALPEYKDQYCFVVYSESEYRDNPSNDDKTWITNWVSNTANGAGRISTLIAVATNNTAATSFGQQKDGADLAASKARQSEIKRAMSNASFNGARNVADFWILSKNLSMKKYYYTAASLWTFPAEDVNKQIAANYQNILDNNTTLSATERAKYEALIQGVLDRGDAVLDLPPITDAEIAEYDAIPEA
ncbi:hypothetical protein AGMMS4952_03210 [Spirochaetia bacterium]|nr:hypothetical protein AGMMS4952_03210 [Spirochaetia bacterium]